MIIAAIEGNEAILKLYKPRADIEEAFHVCDIIDYQDPTCGFIVRRNERRMPLLS